ncbi:hypothetical protein AB1L42_17875 [Thalassoglobus sp. JC818]|uniref:hypothetical protein n=1 Tax=Thalassoglobus sp. JC818 TaxID=3232136 RepID=UPI003457DA49
MINKGVSLDLIEDLCDQMCSCQHEGGDHGTQLRKGDMHPTRKFSKFSILEIEVYGWRELCRGREVFMQDGLLQIRICYGIVEALQILEIFETLLH